MTHVRPCRDSGCDPRTKSGWLAALRFSPAQRAGVPGAWLRRIVPVAALVLLHTCARRTAEARAPHRIRFARSLSRRQDDLLTLAGTGSRRGQAGAGEQ